MPECQLSGFVFSRKYDQKIVHFTPECVVHFAPDFIVHYHRNLLYTLERNTHFGFKIYSVDFISVFPLSMFSVFCTLSA